MRIGKNAAATAVTLTITGAATTASDVANAATFVAGDLLSIQLITSTGTAMANWTATLEAY